MRKPANNQLPVNDAGYAGVGQSSAQQREEDLLQDARQRGHESAQGQYYYRKCPNSFLTSYIFSYKSFERPKIKS